MEQLSVLGSTGSVGVQALDVAEKLGMKIRALSAHGNVSRMEEQIRKFRPSVAVMTDENAARELRALVRDVDCRILSGEEGLCEAAALPGTDIVLNSVVGIAGLRPTMAAIGAGVPRLAIANKETLVAAGQLVTAAAKENHVEILPVDSEHSAIYQCLKSEGSRPALRKILLTASGGPFFGKTAEELKDITPAQALKHPNWSMGAKITIDCATLMNKGLELIEAVWLFGVRPEQVEVVVHRESIIHSMVEFEDASVIAQLAQPDMRLPVQYALTYPERIPSPVKPLDIFACAQLNFARPDEKTFACLSHCREAIARGGLFPAAANGANEQAVNLFLKGKIAFLDIAQLVSEAMNAQKDVQEFTLEQVFEADQNARRFVLSAVG